jgi:hypothetical protein
MTQLVDSFGNNVEYLRLSVTDRCDLRKGFKDFFGQIYVR